MNIKTVDCQGSSKDNLVELVTDLMDEGWISSSVVERTVFSAQVYLGGLDGVTYHVGSYLMGLEEAHRQGEIDQATLVETQDTLGHLDQDDYLVLINTLVPYDEARKATIVHELVHVKQYMDKRLVSLAPGVISWEGQVMAAPTGEVNMDYYMTPWEQEAYDAQARYEADTLGMTVAEVKGHHLSAVRAHMARSQG